MSGIMIEKPSETQLKEMDISSWPIWEKEASKFDWHYDSTETCYLLQGKVTVTTKDGQAVNFGAGDLVVFPKGLSCVWDIQEPVRKHYNFS
ncbi:cupin domain-containing protein [Candidatus Omnitrophota bacterium]